MGTIPYRRSLDSLSRPANKWHLYADMTNSPKMFGSDVTDAELVTQSLAGNRNAFGQIVTRYQTLVCSLAYSATGSLTQSEDLAQETFLAAWKQMAELRDSRKLRAWLCGIVKNLNHRELRARVREPVYGAERLDSTHEPKALEPLPRDQTISREEEAILWRSLEGIPEKYREPMILFYREQQSVEKVAQVMDLSEDVIRQRLSRGRRLLQEEVTAFVENALRQTAPGSALAGSVLAAIPLDTASLGGSVGAAKGSSLFHILSFPIIGLLATLAGSIGIVRDEARPQARQSKMRLIVGMWVAAAGLQIGLLLSRWARNQWNLSQREYVYSQVWCYLLWSAIIAPLVIVFVRRHIAIEPAIRSLAAPPNAADPRLSVFLISCAFAVGALAQFVNLAWQVGDKLSAEITTSVCVAVIVWSACYLYSPRLIGKLPVPPLMLAWVPTVLVVGVILLMLNWRLDRWMAVILGSDLPHAHLFLPMWIIHLSTLLLVGWICIVMTLTRPAGSAPKHAL